MFSEIRLLGKFQWKLWFCTSIAVTLFLTNFWLLHDKINNGLSFNPIKDDSSETAQNFQAASDFVENENFTCDNLTLHDKNSISAFDRMKTNECRAKLKDLICKIEKTNGQWPVVSIKNNCPSYFDKNKHLKYVGCFRDSAVNRILKDFTYQFAFHNSPEYCVERCLNSGYTHAGVEFRLECHCGNADPNVLNDQSESSRRLDDRICQQYKCPNSKHLDCGGFAAVAVYSTGATGDRHFERWPMFMTPPKPASGLEIPYDRPRKAQVKILFFLQLNGRNIRQIRRMLKMIYRPDHLYLAHVDSRQHYMFKELLKVQHVLEASGAKNFRVETERLPGIWGGSSYLEMHLNAIRRTLGNSDGDSLWSNWDYILNLSETDLPLLSIEELEFNLFTKMGASFLSSNGGDTANFLTKQGLNFHFLECEEKMWRISARSHFPKNLRLDGGIDWFVIYRDVAEYAISIEELPKKLRLFYSNVLLPMESFWQTLIVNSQFCERALYKNLRLTNWGHKGSCRCEVWKPVVDWCGCWPTTFRADNEHLTVERCQNEFHFFGRKFDSFIDVDAIAKVEGNVLRERPQTIVNSSPSFSSTWININEAEIDSDRLSPSQVALLNTFAEIILSIATETLSPKLYEQCKFDHVLENILYKANNKDSVKSVLVVKLNCGKDQPRILEVLVEQKSMETTSPFSPKNLSHNGMDYEFVGTPSFGVDLDLKEEIFRTYPSLVYTSTDSPMPIVLWQWKSRVLVENARNQKNKDPTSPPMIVKIFDSKGKLLAEKGVPAYDSGTGIQFHKFNASEFQDVNSGTWTAKIFYETDRKLFGEIKFPVFELPPAADEISSTSNQWEMKFGELIKSHFSVLGVCLRSDGEEIGATFKGLKRCNSVEWSPMFPDEKSQISEGFDYKLDFLK